MKIIINGTRKATIIGNYKAGFLAVDDDNVYFVDNDLRKAYCCRLFSGDEYSCKEYKEPEYQPYTFETIQPDMNCWFKQKETQLIIKPASISSDGIFYVGYNCNFLSYQDLFKYYIKLDGTPAGSIKC